MAWRGVAWVPSAGLPLQVPDPALGTQVGGAEGTRRREGGGWAAAMLAPVGAPTAPGAGRAAQGQWEEDARVSGYRRSCCPSWLPLVTPHGRPSQPGTRLLTALHAHTQKRAVPHVSLGLHKGPKLCRQARRMEAFSETAVVSAKPPGIRSCYDVR